MKTEPKQTSTALAQLTTPDSWTPEHLDLIRKTICHPSMSELEIALFLEQCRRTELDPLRGEAFCVPRRVKITVQGREEWVERYTFQPAETGMAARASKFPSYRGMRSGVFFEKDTMRIAETIDPSSGEPTVARIEHVYEPNKDRGRLVGAWALALREGFSFSPEIVYRQEYEQRNARGEISKAWTKPHTMILKCARSAGWRRVFPEAFSGVYSREEVQLERADEEEASAPPPVVKVSKGDAIMGKVGAKLAQVSPQASLPANMTIEHPVAKQEARPEKIAVTDTATGKPATKEQIKEALGTITNSDVDRAGPPPVEEPKDAAPPAPPSPSAGASTAAGDAKGLKFSFGPPSLRGKVIHLQDTDTLIAACGLAEDEIAKAKGDEKWLPAIKEQLKACDEELRRRESSQDSEPEGE